MKKKDNYRISHSGVVPPSSAARLCASGTVMGMSDSDNYPEDDDSRFNYVLPDEDESETGGEDKDPGKANPWVLLAGIMISPVEGWKALRRSGVTADTIGFKLFLPASLLAGISDFCRLIYDANIGVIDVVISAILTFISFFIGYFFATFSSRILLPKVIDNFLFTDFGKAFSMVSISTLALFHILKELIPIFEPIFYFLPLWTVYIIVKGMRFVKIPQNRSSYTLGVVCVTIVGAPIFVEWAFSFLN